MLLGKPARVWIATYYLWYIEDLPREYQMLTGCVISTVSMGEACL